MERMSGADAAWATAAAAVLVALLLAPAAVAEGGVLLLAAGWCVRIDREEYAVQALEFDGPALNR